MIRCSINDSEPEQRQHLNRMKETTAKLFLTLANKSDSLCKTLIVYVLDENGRVTYAIVAGNSDQFFKIDSDSGLVTVNRPVDSDNMDQARISLNVSASDHGNVKLILPLVNWNTPQISFGAPLS